MKLKNGLKSKKERCFKVTEGTKYFLSTLEVMLPCTLGVQWLLHFPHSSTIAYRAMGTIRYSWIVMAILALWSWISREYKRTILRINNEGVAFSKIGKEVVQISSGRRIEYVVCPRSFRFLFVSCDSVCGMMENLRIFPDMRVICFSKTSTRCSKS